ncbi:YY1 associated factor 2 [Cricetulus griseus]
MCGRAPPPGESRAPGARARARRRLPPPTTRGTRDGGAASQAAAAVGRDPAPLSYCECLEDQGTVAIPFQEVPVDALHEDPRDGQKEGVDLKPRPVSQLVAQQVTQQFVPPTQSKKEKKDKVEKEKSEKEATSKKNCHKKTRPRLKNVDRSSAQHLEVTVGDLTVIITDFKEKAKSAPASSAAAGDQHSQSSCSSDNTERGVSRSSSPRGEASSLNGESH